MITSFNSKSTVTESQREKRQHETKPQCNTTGLPLSLDNSLLLNHSEQTSLSTREHWTLETSSFHPQQVSSTARQISLSAFIRDQENENQPSTPGQMPSPLQLWLLPQHHLPGAAGWPGHSGWCHKHPWVLVPALAVMPSSLWVQHPQPYHTRLKIKDQIPSPAPKTTGWSITCPTEYP